jgi:two-component system sensor histidine kinase ChvG
MSSTPRRTGFKLRTKLFLLFPLLLSIPYVGYEYVREMEDVLRRSLEDSVSATARALALSLHDKPGLFAALPSSNSADSAEIVYAHPLPSPIEIDGYTGDWGQHRTRLKQLPVQREGDATANYVAGSRDGYLYLLITVVDESIVYRNPRSPLSLGADQLTISFRNRHAKLQRYLISTLSPGRATTFEIPSRRSTAPVRIEVRIRAQWQPTPTGYVLEVRVPLVMLGTQFGMRVLDVDTPQPVSELDPFGAARVHPTRHRLVLPSAEIGALIERLGQLEGRRVWVVDRWRRVLARGGTLERAESPSAINPLYGLFLRPPSDEIFEEPLLISQLQGLDVDAALSGRHLTRWRTTSEKNLWVVSAGFPVRDKTGVVGAIVVEETSLSIQTLSREALANLLNKTLMICLVGALLLLLFASRIVTRLRRLSRETEGAIDEHGRVVGRLSKRHGRDEIGELAESFDNMMTRLRDYNSYLENLARRLSHELRTPLAIVRSSVESLQMQTSDETTRTYAGRATEGLSRLEMVITRMSEAARLEQAIQSSTLERFDLVPVLSAIVDAYRSTWPVHTFQFENQLATAFIKGVPDLVVEMVDKLASNARELGEAERPIVIRLRECPEGVELVVLNYGSSLPAPMQDKLFESMVSIRDDSSSSTPHLGLGLYIARLIADFHGASIRAANLANDEGVTVTIRFKNV